MSAVLVTPPRTAETVTFDSVLANVLREAGWIMMGGSAQFRHGALSELQANLRLLPDLGVCPDVLHLARFLGEKAAALAGRNVNDVAAIMALQRTLAEFEQTMKACAAGRH